MPWANRKGWVVDVIALVLALISGVLLGYYGRGQSTQKARTPLADPTASQLIFDLISTERIESNLRKLTESPHIAGRRQDEVELVNYIAESYRDAGFITEIHPYRVLLSYPNDTDSNFVAIKLQNGSLSDKSQAKEKILDESQDKPGVVNPFNAYSKSGDPEGDLVYVNYGTIDDFIAISRKVDLAGKICIARYGRIFRGDKALHAEQYNCSGLILYSDPIDYGAVGESVYPDTWYLPGTGAQRGTLYKKDGDPLTMHYPSIDTAWRESIDDAPLRGIPVTPIGYDDAIKFLIKMAGDEVPEDWRGDLNITYRYGPGFAGSHSNSKMRMHVTTKNEEKITHNVIGYIKGFVEPDRYVIIGNHHDAWVFGALDPSSGTASMLEIARSFGEAVKNGWKPRRTILFCAWGAEEYGMIGSTEWVEEFQKVLAPRTVAYINADTLITGTHSIAVFGSSSLKKMVFDAIKKAPNPNPVEVAAGRKSTYDTWFNVSGNKEPSMKSLGSGSDYTMFLQLTGITSLDVYYDRDRTLGFRGFYPLYHSVYETFDLVKDLVDPDFKYHQASARIIAEIGRNLADSSLLPFNIEDYAAKIETDMNRMLSDYGMSMTADGKIDTADLVDAVANLTISSKMFHKRLQELDVSDHVIYAPSLHNNYGRAAFPGLIDSMFEIGNSDDPRWEQVRRQYAILLYHIGSAASTLEDAVPIRGFSNKHSGYQFEDD